MSPNDAQSLPLAEDKQGPSSLSSKCPPFAEEFPPRERPSLTSTVNVSADAAGPLARYGALNVAALRADGRKVDWLWDGYLVRGGVTLLTSLWKTGKTTLMGVLLARMRAGGLLGGRMLQPGRAVVVSEESPAQWQLRDDKLSFGDHLTWLCRPFRGKPNMADWLGLIGRLVTLRETEGLDLVVIDPLASFLPGRDENTAALMLETMVPLQRLTAMDVSVLIAHHPRKKPGAAGMAARGSGALSGFVDINMEMERFDPSDDLDRRRRIRAYSRFEQTPMHAILELNEAGTDYVHLGDFAQAELGEGWERLRRMLEGAPCKLRREEILDDWPADDLPRPGDTSLRRWLEKALADGRVAREGSGNKNDPHLYWLPGKEVEWPDDPLWFLREEMAFDPVKEERERIRRERREARRRGK
jgi:hypothetical protein